MKSIRKNFKKEIRQMNYERINLILEQPTDRAVKQFDVYKSDSGLFYSKEEVDRYLIKQIRIVFDAMGFE